MLQFPHYHSSDGEGSDNEEERDAKWYGRRLHPLDDFSDKKFLKRFRVTKKITEVLIDDFNLHVPVVGDPRGGGIPIEDRFCLGLRFLATGSDLDLIGDYQGVSGSTAVRCVDNVVDYFYDNHYKFIQWPETVLDKAMVASGFAVPTKRPRLIGAIDGTHIAIRRPTLDAPAYLNRKGFYSLNTMIVSDSNLCITHVDPCSSGCSQDAYCYNNSYVRTQSDAGLLNPFYMLGDSGYGCHQNLFTPVNGPTTRKERHYNRWHRKHRSLVERCIGQLKQRWRCLDHSGGYLYYQPTKAAKIIMACSCLHNVAQRAGVPIQLDNDRDGFKVVHEDIGQPDLEPQPADDFGPRATFIKNYF